MASGEVYGNRVLTYIDDIVIYANTWPGIEQGPSDLQSDALPTEAITADERVPV